MKIKVPPGLYPENLRVLGMEELGHAVVLESPLLRTHKGNRVPVDAILDENGQPLIDTQANAEYILEDL